MADNKSLDFNIIASNCLIATDVDSEKVIDLLKALLLRYSEMQLIAIFNYFLKIEYRSEVLCWIIKELDKFRDSSSLAPLTELLLMKDHTPNANYDREYYTNVRVLCARAISNLKNHESVHALLYCLNNKNENYKIRLSCADALGKLGDKYAVASLIDVVDDEEEKSVYIRESAAVALGLIGDMRAVDSLVRVLENQNGIMDKFTYLKEKELTPKVGLRVMTADGAGTVTDSKPMTGIVKVKLDSAGEDSEPVIFLRNDVVPESDYHGQKLTKTDTRDKKTDKDDAYIFSLFESEKADPDTGNTEQEQVSNPVQKDRREQTQKKNHKQRSGVFSSNTETPEKPQKEIAEKNKTNESSSGKPFRNKNKMNPGVQTNNAQTQSRDTKKQDPKKKKKFFKPYFRQNKKNKDEK